MNRILKGQINIKLLTFLVIGVVAIVVLLPMVQVATIGGAISRLENQGYIILAAGEYNTMITLLTDIDTKADAAVANASLAVVAAQAAVATAQTAADKVDLFNTADCFLFPADTDYWVLLTASAAAGTFTACTEIVDNNAVTLSSKFAVDAGYISDAYIYQVTAPADTTHIVEIAYGAAKTSLTRIMFNSDSQNIAQVKSRRIPAGTTIYYRIMTTAAPTEYVSIGFRYFYE